MTKIAILVVEDESIIAKGIEKQLRSMGYIVAGTAKNGEDAVRKAIDLHPDLILMDISLGPGIDGVEAAGRIRAAIDVPILYLTANANDAILDRVKSTHPFGYLLKPYDDKDLQTAIEIGLYRHQVERRLRENEQWLAATLGSIGDGVIATDERGRVRYLNALAERLTGWCQAEAIGQDVEQIFRIVNESSREPVESPAIAALRKGEPTALAPNTLLIDRTGVERPIDDSAAPIRDVRGAVSGAVLVFRDISERRRIEDALFTERERARVTLDSIGDAVISTDPHGGLTYLNAAAERLTGWSDADASGRSLPEVFNVVDATTRVRIDDPSAIAMQLHQKGTVSSNWLLIRRDGSELPIEDSAAPIHRQDGRVEGAVIVFRDVTSARALLQKTAHLAQYDGLTDLPNRALFDDRLAQAIVLARRQGTRVAVLFVDLDRFKQINDALGHAIGDTLLQLVTARLLASVRASDTVGRRGGDEFVVLLSHLKRADDAVLSAEKILGALAAPYDIAQHMLHVTASVGIGIYPDDSHDADALISAADEAMYHAKKNGGNNCQFFTPQMNTRRLMRRMVESHLREALDRQEFTLHYQPKVDLATLLTTGVEALVRWQHPTRGLLGPGEFITVAEESGLILSLGRWVLGEACRQARAWQDGGMRPIPIAVNVSAIEFRAPGFLEQVTTVLRTTGLEAHHLELEVTESVLMAEADSTTAALSALKTLGVHLAIDDFGTGYSSLSYLSRFPVDTLKIDRSFINGMSEALSDAAIINAVIGMGRSLGLRVVAEGVETAEQLARLRHLSCGEGQGYYFGRPVTADQLARRLAEERP